MARPQVVQMNNILYLLFPPVCHGLICSVEEVQMVGVPLRHDHTC